MRGFQADTQITFWSRLPVMCLSLISVILLTRILGPEGNGIYTFAFASLNLFIVFFGLQLESALPYFLSRHPDKINSIFTSTVLLGAFLFLIFLAVLSLLVFCIPGISAWFIPPDQPVWFFFCFLILVFLFRKTSLLFQAALRGVFQFKLFNLLLLLNQAIPVFFYSCLLLYVIFANDVLSYLFTFKLILALEGFLALMAIYLVIKSKLFNRMGKLTAIKPILHYAAKDVSVAAGHFLNKRLDVWFVQFFHGTIALGQYGLATQIANFISEAMTPFSQVMTPYIAGTPGHEHSAIITRSARLHLLIAGTAAVLIFSTAWIWIPLVFGKAFDDAILATQILAIGIIAISQRLVFTGYFRAINQLIIPFTATWIGVVATITLDFLLIPRYGIEGAAWATLGAYTVSAVYIIRKAKQLLGFTFISVAIPRLSDIQWLLSGLHRKKQSDQL